jgi:hypothetical protein
MVQPLFRTPGDDLAGYLTRYPHEVAFGDEEPAAVFSRYHTDDFVLRNDGIDLDRDRLLAHVRSGRRNVEEIRVEVHQALTSASRVAGRYTLTALMRRGQVIATEIYMFGELNGDGRLQRVEQLSRDVSAKEPAH